MKTKSTSKKTNSTFEKTNNTFGNRERIAVYLPHTESVFLEKFMADKHIPKKSEAVNEIIKKYQEMYNNPLYLAYNPHAFEILKTLLK